MKLKINGKVEDSVQASKLNDLVQEKALQPEKIVIELNKEIIPKENWETTLLKDNDAIEIVSFVGGG